jgi:hypothetical protein
LLTTATADAEAEVDVAVVAAPYLDPAEVAFVLVVLVLLPHPAASSATVVATAPREKGCLTVAS